jgi:hypothetical protein
VVNGISKSSYLLIRSRVLLTCAVRPKLAKRDEINRGDSANGVQHENPQGAIANVIAKDAQLTVSTLVRRGATHLRQAQLLAQRCDLELAERRDELRLGGLHTRRQPRPVQRARRWRGRAFPVQCEVVRCSMRRVSPHARLHGRRYWPTEKKDMQLKPGDLIWYHEYEHRCGVIIGQGNSQLRATSGPNQESKCYINRMPC